ncbi:hypothetical protein EW146_g7330 [Bondarzewia mesenterica]|uniref:Uncharacterized protein n=1 Tax=Bondarzewia mesenterica TaxID=1095465 RepID=A0A4S4LLL9_9AGAM|nr:hypothetical protein EW146_g7330 [Bondarzewia mesenterica]
MMFTHQCVPLAFPTTVVGFLMAPLALDALLFALTMIKFHQSLHEGWARAPWISQFMQDGVWAFALPLLVTLFNVLCMMLADSTFSSVAFMWSIAIPGSVGYRLVIHLRKFAPVDDHPYSETVDEIEFDTIALTNMTDDSAKTGDNDFGRAHIFKVTDRALRS